MAYLIERDFKEFYEEAKEMVADENVKKLLQRLSDWERGHEAIFKPIDVEPVGHDQIA